MEEQAQKKADELIEKHGLLIINYDKCLKPNVKELAKQCALIAVDEIKSVIVNIEQENKSEDYVTSFDYNADDDYSFWERVKEIIQTK